MRISQYLSALIASGNGQKCNEFCNLLHDKLLVTDQESGQTFSSLFKNGRETHPEKYKIACKQIAEIMDFCSQNVDDFYFGDDIKPRSTNGQPIS